MFKSDKLVIHLIWIRNLCHWLNKLLLVPVRDLENSHQTCSSHEILPNQNEFVILKVETKPNQFIAQLIYELYFRIKWCIDLQCQWWSFISSCIIDEFVEFQSNKSSDIRNTTSSRTISSSNGFLEYLWRQYVLISLWFSSKSFVRYTVQDTERWKQELSALATASGLGVEKDDSKPSNKPPQTTATNVDQQHASRSGAHYSTRTGRFNEGAGKSRGRTGSRHATANPDILFNVPENEREMWVRKRTQTDRRLRRMKKKR